MTSHISLVICGLLLVSIIYIVQSIPIEKANEIVQPPSIDNKQAVKQELLKSVEPVKSSSISTSTSPAATVSQSSSTTKQGEKKKRNIHDDNDQLDGFLDSESESNENDDVNSYQLSDFKLNNNNNKFNHILHAKIQETSAKIHDNADKPVNTDDSIVFSDIKMTPNDLTDIVRRRRDIKLNTESNRRRKRALSPFDYYNTDSLYDPYVDFSEELQYARPARSFAPLYWYPSVYERNIRSALESSLYESPEWPKLYSSNIVNDEIDEDPLSMFDDDENLNDYESNRYPILSQSSNNLFDNLQLQQRYNTDDLPIDEDIEQDLNEDDDDDDDEEYRSFYPKPSPHYTRFGSMDTYFE